MIRACSALILSGLCRFSSVRGAGAAEPTQEELRDRFKQRHEDLVRMKISGKVGETSEGYLEAITPVAGGEAPVKAMLTAENQDRRQLYALLARNEKTSVQEVARQNAILKFTKAGKDEYFKGKDGVWRKKSEMVK